jgi:RNA polymerase sigma factor (sigma-70 family)
MAPRILGGVLRHLHKLTGGLPGEDVSDGQLLEQFVNRREERAFAELLSRHGPLVLGVCRRVLRQAQDAEDAFQATFLILAKKAASIRRPEALATWLYEVAYRVALKARAEASRRRLLNPQEQTMPPLDPLAAAASQELRAILDEELHRLPEKYRAPLVLCYLQGQSNEEAARRLGWTKGTVSGRLARARDLLRGRLARRGLALAAGVLVPALAETGAGAAVPAALAETTTRAAVHFGAGGAAAGLVSPPVATLTEGVLKTMFLTKLKLAVVMAAFLCGVGLGAGVWVRQALAAKPGADTVARRPGAGASAPRLMAAPIVRPAKSPFHQALEAAQDIPDAPQRVEVLEQIALAQAKAGDPKGATKTFAQACKVARTLPADAKARTLVSLGLLQTQSGDRAGARKAFQEGVAVAEAIEDTDARINTLISVGIALAAAKDRPAARKAFQLARKAADTLTSETNKISRIGWIAFGQARAGLVKEALKTATDLTDESAQREAYHQIAVAQARAGDFKAALQTAKKISTLGDTQNRTTDTARVWIAWYQAESGDLKGALATAATLTHDGVKAATLANIAVAQAGKKDRRAALKTLQQALAAADRIDKGTEKEQQLQTIAAAQVQVGDLDGARKTADAIKDDGFKALALATLAVAQAKGKKVKAARGTIRAALFLLEQSKDDESGGNRAGRRRPGGRRRGRANGEERGFHTMSGQNQWMARMEIVKAQLHMQDFKGALETTRGLQWKKFQAPLFRRIAQAQAAAGQDKDALAWVAQLESPYAHALALLGVATGSSPAAGAK